MLEGHNFFETDSDLDGRNREMKTTFQQWELIINFMEENPSLLKNKFKNFDGDREDGARLWHELTMKLNSMGLGTRSTEKWQLAIGRWKSKTKAKASQLRIEMERTGGGPVKAPPLNQVEERLMALLGWKSVTGDKNLELGLPPLMPLKVTDISSKTPEPTTSRVEVPSPPSNEQVPSLPSNPEPLQKPWTFSYGEKHISISKDIAIKLQIPDIIAINFLYQSYCNKFAGCILNEEDGFKTDLQVSVFLNILKQALPIKQHICILIITPGYLIEKWQNRLENTAEYKVIIVNSTTCPTDLHQESDVAFLLSFEDIKLTETLAQLHLSSLIIDHFDVVASKRVIRSVEGDFNIGITRRNFYKNPDQKLQWTMLNWANPMSVGKLVDFYEADNDNFANLRDDYHHWWFTLTWEYCDSFKRNSDEDDDPSPQYVNRTKRTYKKRKRKSSSNVPKGENVISTKSEELSVEVITTKENKTKINVEDYRETLGETKMENDSSDSQDTIEYVLEDKSDINNSKTDISDNCNIIMDIIEGTSTQTYLEKSDHKSQVDLEKEELYSQLFNDNPSTDTNTDNSSKDYLLSLI